MLKKEHYPWLVFGVVAIVIILDQALKLWIKTNFYLGEDYEILPWFHLRFVQNNGFAFGMELGSKVFLTLFRIVFGGFLCWYLYRIARTARVALGYMVMVALCVAGAFGNVIDCVFYGEIFNNPYPPEVATFVLLGEGYAPWLQGRVVDMFWFPLFSFRWPEWMPFVGGEVFSFFDPVFNIADAAISVGIIAIILFYSRFLENFRRQTGLEKTNA